jgi:hypothetical protein
VSFGKNLRAMRTLHSPALAFGLGHFIACAFLGGFVLLISVGYGLSDAYHPPAGWVVAMDQAFVALEAPVAVALRLLYHPTARFEPPRLFALDYAMSSNVLVALALCLLWSVAFGYLAAIGMRRARAAWSSSPENADARLPDEQYVGPRCVSCRAPIGPGTAVCSKCGWTQP